MGVLVVACYAPKRGCAERLLALVAEHLTPLRAAGFVTPIEAIVMRATDGTIVEIFELSSQDAIAAARSSPVVLDLRQRFDEVCTYRTPAELSEFQDLFPRFEPV